MGLAEVIRFTLFSIGAQYEVAIIVVAVAALSVAASLA